MEIEVVVEEEEEKEWNGMEKEHILLIWIL